MMIVIICLSYRCVHYVTAVYVLMNMLTESKNKNHVDGSELANCFLTEFDR